MDGKILIVDDEETIRTPLRDYLARQGFKTFLAEDGIRAVEKTREERPDIVVLDFQLPLLDGLDVCRKIRQEAHQSIGIIMISGVRKEAVDRTVGLELGADVYMTKPFEVSELVAQIRALLRRMQSEKQVATTGWLIADDYLRINFRGRTVKAGGKEVHLTKLEFDLLKYLAERSGIAVARSDLIDHVWGYEAGGDISDGAVNVAITKLRAKIEPDPANPRYIHSKHGIGYCFKIRRDRRE
jgi:two-component system, OmpR family, response regulator VicR